MLRHVTSYISSEELTLRFHRTSQAGILWTYFKRLEAFLSVIDPEILLVHSGGPRTVERNKVVGGHPHSRHLWKHGDADDFVIAPGSPTGDYDTLVSQALRCGLYAIAHDVGSGMHLHVQIPKRDRQRLLEELR